MTAQQDDTEHVSFLSRRVPGSFELRVLVLPAGDRRVYRPADWHDTIIVIEQGELELECKNEVRIYFGRGDSLFLSYLEVIAMHSCGPEPLVLTAVNRPGFSGGSAKC